MDQYSNIELVPQPKNFRRNLYKHQLSAIHKLENLEHNNDIKLDEYSNEERYITTNIGIFSDITGYGKTSSIIGLIIRDKMRWELSNNYVHSSIEGVLGDGRVKIFRDKIYKRLNTNLVIANQSIIKQWKNELEFTDLKVDMITTKLKCSKNKPEDFDVILCSPSMYNRYTKIHEKYSWKRLIFDEPTHTKIPSMNTIICGFIWFVTATPYLLLNKNCNRMSNFLYSLFNYNTPESIFSKLIVKNQDEFVKLSCKLPDIDHKYYKCYQPIVNIINGFINDQVLTMIQAGDIRSAVKYLGGDESDNIHELVKARKLEDLEDIKQKIIKYERRNDQERLNKWKLRKSQVEDNIKELDERFKDALNSNCNICLSSMRQPILLSCCQNLFCGKCIFKWLETKRTCPLCRSNINSDNIIYIKKEGDSENVRSNNDKTKNEILIDIINENKKGKFIIFSSYDETFNKIKHICDDLDMKISSIQGTVEQRSKIIESFKKGDINIIFLNSNHNGAGINLQEATDLILYHKMNEDLETQIVGRANRIGRTNSLKIHHLI